MPALLFVDINGFHDAAFSVALGTLSGGRRAPKTMGTRITKVNPVEGVYAETAGAATKHREAVRWGVTINLVWAWVPTIPASALLAALVYGIVKHLSFL